MVIKRYSLQDFLALPIDSEDEFMSEYERERWKNLEKMALKYPEETKRPVFGIDFRGGKQSRRKYCDFSMKLEARSDLEQYFPQFCQNSCRVRGKSVTEERAEQIIRLFGPWGPFPEILLELSLYSIFLKDLDMTVAISGIGGLWPFDYQGEAVLGWYASKSLEWNEKMFAENGRHFEDTIEWVIWFHTITPMPEAIISIC